jgi:hypothetical protein
MLEGCAADGDDRRLSFFLAKDRMAAVALFRDDLSFSAYMLAVVASEAAGKVKVADVVGMSPPVHFHLGEDGRPEDALHLGNRRTDRLWSLGIQVRIACTVEGVDLDSDPLHGRVGRSVRFGQSLYGLLLDKGQ